ncbi:uncharacterized protein LOC131251335 [Magnolia sinica]|uniref:uncharacterized protein LOC131251335 n=1 Tax=Magnolia sinica TaxID=86752 RepID=UPI0026587D3D|nr:uncharacterized protein LOC131251335 [Magnolia sinica]
MVLFGLFKKKITGVGIDKPKRRSIPLTSLASVESLTLPRVQVIVLKADLGCVDCQKRLARVVSRIGTGAESMEVDLLEKKVTLTCRVAAVRGSTMEVAAVRNYRNPRKDVKKMLIFFPPCN